MSDEIEWPREIWMREREEHDQGVVRAVLSDAATVARFEGDKERDAEFHRYVDSDIHDSAERYWRQQVETLRADNKAAVAEAVRDERERCAGIADKQAWRHGGVWFDAPEQNSAAIAEAIRGEGE